jgi:hypothetical protein
MFNEGNVFPVDIYIFLVATDGALDTLFILNPSNLFIINSTEGSEEIAPEPTSMLLFICVALPLVSESGSGIPRKIRGL